MIDCWDIDNMECTGMKEDCLHTLKFIFVDIYVHNTYSRMCTYSMLIFHIPLWAGQFYDYSDTFNVKFLAQYGPTSLGILYMLISMVIVLSMETYAKNCFTVFNQYFWSVQKGSVKLKKKILNISKLVNYVLGVNIFLAIMCCVFLVLRYREHKEYEVVYQITFIQKHFPNYAPLLCAIFYVSAFTFVIPAIWITYVLTYFTLHVYFQAELLNERIFKIVENFKNSYELISNNYYQKQVRHRLRFCAIRVQHLRRCHWVFIWSAPVLVILYTILGILFLICLTAAYNFDQDKYYPLIVSLIAVCGYTLVVTLEMGQIIEDNTNIYHALICLPWYTFDTRNRKMFLFLLMHAQIPVTLSPYESVTANRSTLVQFYKIFSSTSAVLASMSKKLE